MAVLKEEEQKAKEERNSFNTGNQLIVDTEPCVKLNELKPYE